MKTSLKRSFYMGLFCCPIGILIGIYISISAIGSGYDWFPFYAGLASFLTPLGFWIILIETHRTYRISLGIAVGILSGIISHYVCWYLWIISANVQHLFFDSFHSSLGDPPMNLIEGFTGSLGLTYFSLLFFGWLTIPAGGIIGGIYCWHLKRKVS